MTIDKTEATQRFTQAVEERKHAMYRVALMMLRSPDDAQDAVSDALETTWRRILNIRNLDALPTYLMRCTINACHAVLRKRKRETTAEDVAAWLPPALPETPVWMYLSGLSHKYRLPLQLRYGEGMSDQDIASILRLPRGTISSRLSRGLRMLKQQIDKEEQGRG